MDSTGVYRCTASNDVGEENCTIEVTMQREFLGGEKGGHDPVVLTSHQTATLINGHHFILQLETHFHLSAFYPLHSPSSAPPPH